MLFDDKLAKLNTQQRLAVSSIEGPVMVIAGPGTGKTEILSLRIGYILKNTDTAPGNILCLTYTDAAATEMRHRLIEYIGPEAYRIQVSTFHSFCNLVIQENPSVFQQARELEPISDIDKFKLLQQLMDDFGPEHPLKKFKGQLYWDWKRLDELFSTMKKENWSPQYMIDQIERYIEQRRNSEDFIYKRKSGENQAGDFKTKDFKEKVLDKMAPLEAAVLEYDHFNALLAENGQYDFDDMLLWVFKAFSENPDLLANYQERFLYFLVDEFQDTNGIQISILQKLIDHEWLDRPNVFVVGDDDQAIFRFQGANIENLIEFYQRYEPLVIFLDENYRSSQLILNASRVVMDSMEDPRMKDIFKQAKTLKASGQAAAHTQQVIIQSYPNLDAENADVFHQLKTWHEQKIDGEIAVLYSKHELGRELAQALKGAGIPFHSQKRLDALKHPMIGHLLSILQCIHQLSDGADNDDALVYQILHLRYLQPNSRDLQTLMLAYTPKERDSLTTFYSFLGDKQRLDLLPLTDRKWMDSMFSLLDRSIVEYHSRTLVSFVEWIVHEYGILQWILHQPEKFTFLFTLKTFYNFVEAQSAAQNNLRVPGLLELCDLMSTYNIALPVQELTKSGTGIHLSSLHGAKGLEFEKVIIKNMTDNEWEKKKQWNQNFSYPDNLVRIDSVSATESSDQARDQDRRRLLYVGMTRAKQELMLTYANAKTDGKGLLPSVYLSELETKCSDILKGIATTDNERIAEYQAAYMSGEQKADLLKDDQVIRERVKNYVLNVSALNTYLECPLRFYYEKILVIPSSEAAPLLFGTALHDALNRYFRKRFEEKDTTKGKAYLVETFGWSINRERHQFTPKEFEDYLVYGKKILGQFYDEYASTWSDAFKYKVEYDIRDVHIEGVPVRGFIDRIDLLDNNLFVYDYKSGNPDRILKKIKGPGKDDVIGGHYWRQMVFYDLLLEADPRNKRGMSEGWILGLEPKKDGTFLNRKVTVTDDDRSLVRQQIVDTWSKIQNLEFENGCGECAWCKMHDLNPPLLEQDEDGEA
ncbi:MAG TPA: ATP-dependent DNA helicase [Saprospiraceae bacterium]|nr:ATP-dependent DNA helicase [Saprospiraceae bacterium]